MGPTLHHGKLFLVGYTTCIFVLLLVQSSTAALIEKNIVTCRNETTQILVNETTLERCAYLCWSDCYCNITREKPVIHTTTICEELTVVEDDGRAGESRPNIHMRKLTDPEVAAIAVIASLVFSILISVTVFLIQKRRRPATSLQKAADPESTLHGKSVTDEVGSARLFTVQPANRVENVYEDVLTVDRHSGEPEAVRLLAGSGEVYYTKPVLGLKSLPLAEDKPTSSQQPPRYLDKSGAEASASSESEILLTERSDPTSQYITANTSPHIDGDKHSGANDDLDNFSHSEIVYENFNHPDTKTSDL